MATFHLTDGTEIADVTTYSRKGDRYSVFTGDGGHRYVQVDDVDSITPRPRTGEARLSWYDLPVAADMWAADGRDVGA